MSKEVRAVDDYLLKLDIATLGSLGDSAFTTAVEPPEIYTVSFWFYVAENTETKIIANLGNKTLAQKGWTVYLQGSSLNFRVNLSGETSMQLSTALEHFFGWHHFVGVMNSTTGEIQAFLNGSGGWTLQHPQELVEAGSVSEDFQLTIGGYTDAAGGHFNYRFGEAPSEWVDDFRIYSRALKDTEIASFLTKGTRLVTANFTSTQDPKTNVVSFDGSASQGEGLTCLWYFGDGSSALGQQVEHLYAYTSTFEVSLHIFDYHHRHNIYKTSFEFRGQTNLPEKVPVFVNGTEGYACFRIPAIIRATNGDLLAFAEGRLVGCSDATQVIHVVCKRSKDMGQSWLPLQVVAQNFFKGTEYACMNPSPVVDSVHGTGKIVVVYNKIEYSEWAITQGQGITRVFCIASYDHGASWIEEQDITLQVHKPYNPSYVEHYPGAALLQNKDADWRKQVPTLGHAIQLHGTQDNPRFRGRFFFIGCRTEGSESVFYTQNYAFWSDDLGKSWHIGDTITLREDGSSARGLNEASAVELMDGSVMVNSRNYQNGKVVGVRAVTLGQFDKNGQLHFGTVRHDPTLIDSGVQASVLKHQTQQGTLLVFTNPCHPRARKCLTLHLSLDEGQTWPVAKLLDPGPVAYSDLVSLAPNSVGILYEQGNHGGIVYVWICAGIMPA